MAIYKQDLQEMVDKARQVYEYLNFYMLQTTEPRSKERKHFREEFLDDANNTHSGLIILERKADKYRPKTEQN